MGSVSCCSSSCSRPVAPESRLVAPISASNSARGDDASRSPTGRGAKNMSESVKKATSSSTASGTYQGQMQGDQRHGQGKFTYPNGDTYDGQWIDNKASGQGTFKTRGSLYSGSWECDLKHGQGEERFFEDKEDKKTKLVYVGEFRQGYRHGYGELTWQDESCYVGRFVNNNQEGYGCFKWRNKHKFEGEWLDNYMHGQGRYGWPDGTAFEGQYQMNLKHGEGTFLSKDGHQMNCRWVHGKPSGSVSFRTPHADSQPTVWNEGVMLSWATKSEEGTPRGQNDARAAFMPRASA